MKMTMTMTK